MKLYEATAFLKGVKIVPPHIPVFILKDEDALELARDAIAAMLPWNRRSVGEVMQMMADGTFLICGCVVKVDV